MANDSERIFLVVVDDSPEMPLALHFACRRAAKIGGGIALLHIIDNAADFQHWLGIGELHREELHDEGQVILQRLSAQVMESTGQSPLTYIREGEKGPTLYEFLSEESSIQAVVIAAGVSNDGPGPIINYAFKNNVGLLPKPFIIVPGSMTVEEINAIT